MIDTNNSDFDSMQSEAIRFAQEMRQKAGQSPPQRQDGSPETPFCRNACPVKSLFGTGNQGSDSDIMLLMALMLVLTGDGGDRMLLLALLYIMT